MSKTVSTTGKEILYTKGTRIWLADPAQVWKSAEITKDFTGGTLEVVDEENKAVAIPIKTPTDLPPLRNPDILIGQNDLTSLSYLHEPAVLYNLQYRFCNHNTIYTYCGIVLVAINPYEELDIYNADTIWAYRGQSMGDLDPHIFAVAEEAYTKMERDGRDQSIIVSGESGAGKTVSAKYAMRYFATVGGSENETHIEKKVLASSPIMEAIGNAKTTRNDNSSRFGKYVELHFDSKYSIMGASMRTYLLEKSRVCFQSEDERNYHIFYQLCAARDSHPEISELYLDDCQTFHYTRQGDAGIIDGVSDTECFKETVEALTLLGFGVDNRRNFFKLLAAILHLGNVRINGQSDKESCSIAKDDGHLEAFSVLLGVDFDSMRKWLCNRRIVSQREEFIKGMSEEEANFCKDALAKMLYAEAFNWVVDGVNGSLKTSGKFNRFIGVLDIYGFETFEINSFEQFCINYANEKLQQQFNQHVFKLEQEEYVKEGIQWTFIEFYDNQPCIDLIETKLGILDLLDEECRMPQGSDASWTLKLYAKCTTSVHFAKPRMSNVAFIISHFADKVEYQSTGFLEKNRDTVLQEQVSTVAQSKNEWLTFLLRERKSEDPHAKKAKVTITAAGAPAPAPSNTKVARKQTVGSQFRDSLTLLMSSLNATTPHYVRCIKPNDVKTSFQFDPHRAVQQLRACGVLETIRISAAGFPSRWTYADFFGRYRVLCHSKDIRRADMRVTCEKIILNIIKDEDEYRFGKTKIFFRAGQVAFMEKMRFERLRRCGIMIQKHVKGWLYRNRYRKIRVAALGLQRHGRGMLARRKALLLRQTAAAITLQKHLRRFVARRRYLQTCNFALRVQCLARGFLARKRANNLRRVKAATIIQRVLRGHLARKRYQKAQRNVILIQSCIRRYLAKKRLRSLKMEARSLEHVKQLNKGLENKIISQQQKIEEMGKDIAKVKVLQAELATLKAERESVKSLEQRLKQALADLAHLETTKTNLEIKLKTEMEEKVDLVAAKAALEGQISAVRQEKSATDEKVSTYLAEIEALKSRSDESERLLTELRNLEKERDSERHTYQQMIVKLADSEAKIVNLEQARNPVPLPRKNVGSHSRMGSDDTVSSGFESIISSGVETYRANQPNTTLSPVIASLKMEPASGDAEVFGDAGEDVGLILILQQKLKSSEDDKQRLQRIIDEKENESPYSDKRRTQDMIRLQELEMENAKLRDDLNHLRESIDLNQKGDKSPMGEVHRQFINMQEELARKREESIQLRTVLASPNHSNSSQLNGDDEDEIGLILQTQKTVIQQLEKELQSEKTSKATLETELRNEMTSIKADNERQQKLLNGNLKATPGSKNEELLQYEVRRLTSENLDIREKNDNLQEQIRKLKRQLKNSISKKPQLPDDMQYDGSSNFDETIPMPVEAVVHRKEREYRGMLEYASENESKIMRALIFDLKPQTAVNAIPGLPAYVLFMCIRYTDHMNDDEKVRSLLTQAIHTVKKIINKNVKGVMKLELSVLWLSNVLRLLHTLKQYSGDANFQRENSPQQNEQALKNFDLSEYRQVLSDIAVWIYTLVIKTLEEKIQPLIVAALLENDSGVTSSVSVVGNRSRASSVSSEPGIAVKKPLDAMTQELDIVHSLLNSYALDPEVVIQMFRQLFYYMCAGALNNLLLRKDLCNWAKGMQIRYNVSMLEEWCLQHKINADVTTTLQPLIQASRLLQARKGEGDVDSICGICDKLTISQVTKILNLYSSDEYEETRLSTAIIRKIDNRLKELRKDETPQLLMDAKFAFAVKFPFNPSTIRLETIEIPETFGLGTLVKRL